jgi:hypothetical protein
MFKLEALMQKRNQKQMQALLKCAALGVALVSLAGCVVEPYPEAPMAAAPPPPGPAPYYGCCYSYPQYPPYYYGGYGYGYGGPSVGLAFYGGGGWHGDHGWRGR